MISSAVKLEEINKEYARTLAILHIDHILQFVESVNRSGPNGFCQLVLLLKELRWRVEKSSPPLRSEQEILEYLTPVANRIIGFSPVISKQLDNFWKAQNRIIRVENEKQIRYSPADLIDEYRDTIRNINERSEKVMEQFVRNPHDEINIDALLYMHILKTEAYGNKLKKQLEDKLRRNHLENEFNAAEIYSILGAVVQKRGKKIKYLTDAEAIRNALAHNNYKISQESDSWMISFDNNGEYNYVFQKKFTMKQFRWYLSNLEILYKATTTLIYALALWAILRNRLLEK